MQVRSSTNETTAKEEKSDAAHQEELEGEESSVPARDAPDFEGGLPVLGNMLQVGLLRPPHPSTPSLVTSVVFTRRDIFSLM